MQNDAVGEAPAAAQHFQTAGHSGFVTDDRCAVDQFFDGSRDIRRRKAIAAFKNPSKFAKTTTGTKTRSACSSTARDLSA